MEINAQTNLRLVRPTLVIAGLLAFVSLTWSLLQAGVLRMDPNLYLLWVPLWIAGFVALVYQPWSFARLDPDTLVISRTLWCNIGAITLAVLVPSMLRLLLLAVPLFSVLYAAIHLARSQLFLITLVSAGVYTLGVSYLLSANVVDLNFELLTGFAFAALLAGVLLISAELQAVRDGLAERNRGLRDAMERLQDMASKDDLTGLHNRRSIMELLGRQKALADRGGQTFTLCYCDLDHFKTVNDQYGHAVGDVALKQFAELASAVVRNVDYVARFGGEEYLLVLVDADAKTAEQVAQRLAEHTRQMWIPGTAETFSMTVSVGIASYQVGERVHDLVARADEALYQAKRAGRDRVVVV